MFGFENEIRTKVEDGKMQIILQEDVEKLGTRGQLVEVAEGYARNFLLPRKLALEASPGNMKRLEKMRAAFAKKEATEKEAASTLAGLLANVSIELARKAGESDQLFGSVTSADISEALETKGYTVDKRKIVLADPIKVVGEYDVPIKLHRDVTPSIKVVVRKEE
jgi:large subunit ribosomal protein L9